MGDPFRRRLRRDLGNLSLLARRDFDGFIVSMHQSGTHWLKFMLGHLASRAFEVPPPSHIGDNSVVGHPKSPPRYPGLPRIVQSHGIPSPLVHAWFVHRLLRFPPYVLLVRDVRAALVSHYEKWKGRYGVPFSTYLRGDPAGRRYDKDIWWDIRFLNAWSRVLERMPERVLVLRYEDLRADPVRSLRAVWRHFGLAEQPALEYALAAERADKRTMARVERPGDDLKVVRLDERSPFAWYAPADREFLVLTLAERLRADFGYDYARWEQSERAAGEQPLPAGPAEHRSWLAHSAVRPARSPGARGPACPRSHRRAVEQRRSS